MDRIKERNIQGAKSHGQPQKLEISSVRNKDHLVLQTSFANGWTYRYI